MNALTPGVENRCKEHVTSIRNVYIEIDENGETALEKLRLDVANGLIPRPHRIIQSSPGKFYAIWQVDGMNVETQEAINGALQVRFGADEASVDASRVLRVPGTLNLKYDSDGHFLKYECRPLGEPALVNGRNLKYDERRGTDGQTLIGGHPVVKIIEEHDGEYYTAESFKIEFDVKPKVEYIPDAEQMQASLDFYEEACHEAGVELGTRKIWKLGGQQHYLFEVECPNSEEHSDKSKSGGSVKIHPNGAFSYSCFHGHCADFKWAQYRAYLETEAGHPLTFGEKGAVPEIGTSSNGTNNGAGEIPNAQMRADAAVEASENVDLTFPFDSEIPEFDDTVVTGVFREIVDAICLGTTIPRQYALAAVKSMACAILTKYEITLENCESTRSYFIVFGDTGLGKGLAFRRLKLIVDATNSSTYVHIIQQVDSEAGLRDTFFDIPSLQNYPMFFFIDEVTTVGHKSDGKKQPEIVDLIIELANSTTVSRTKAKKGKGPATKSRPDSWFLVYACAQDAAAFALAFPRTKKQGFSDRFIAEYSPKIEPGDLPDVDMTKGVRGLMKLLEYAQRATRFKMAEGIREKVNEAWKLQETEVRQVARLRQQFILEMYLSTFNRGSEIAEQQDLEIAIKWLDRQKPIRRKFFAEEIPNQVGVYSDRLKAIHRDMLRRLRRKGAAVDPADVALTLPQLMTQTLAYKENDLPNFNQAWKAQSPFWLEVKATNKTNRHTYKKFVPTPEETDMWLSPDLTKGKSIG